MNTSAIKALLNSDHFKLALSVAMHNVMYNQFSVDHVFNRAGKCVLSLRLRNGRVVMRDSKNNDVTSIYLSASI